MTAVLLHVGTLVLFIQSFQLYWTASFLHNRDRNEICDPVNCMDLFLANLSHLMSIINLLSELVPYLLVCCCRRGVLAMKHGSYAHMKTT